MIRDRLWFDKADGQTLFGVFDTQRFYSSEFAETYEGEEQHVRDLNELVALYSEWAKANYLERRAGRDQIPLPEPLRGVKLGGYTDEEPEVADGESEAEAHEDSEEG